MTGATGDAPAGRDTTALSRSTTQGPIECFSARARCDGHLVRAITIGTPGEFAPVPGR